MSDLRDYIKWRGDLTFEQSSFNEVDNLIFSFISYVDFSGIVPGSEEDTREECEENRQEKDGEYKQEKAGKEKRETVVKKITVREASRQFWDRFTEQEILEKSTLTKMSAFVLRDMAESRRFGNLYLSDFRNEIDEDSQKQFAALTICLEEDLYYLAFRGTDETIVGWQEDFNMVYAPEVPSERRAAEYLQDALKRRISSGKQNARFYIGGHSKGGHLAVYAAVKCFDRFRDQIIQVFNNDGPGVSESVAATAEYEALLPRLVSYIPEQSFFGLMLIHRETAYTVKSSRSGLMQHDCLSWEVLGPEFVKADGVASQSRGVNDGLKSWLSGLTMEERKEIVELIFSSLSLAEIRTIGDFASLTPKKIYDMIRSLKGVDAREKELLNRAFRLLIHALKGKNR